MPTRAYFSSAPYICDDLKQRPPIRVVLIQPSDRPNNRKTKKMIRKIITSILAAGTSSKYASRPRNLRYYRALVLERVPVGLLTPELYHTFPH